MQHIKGLFNDRIHMETVMVDGRECYLINIDRESGHTGILLDRPGLLDLYSNVEELLLDGQ